MALYKEMIPNKPVPPDTETSFTAAGYVNGMFTLAIGPLRICLTKGERDAAIHTWGQLESGVNPATGLKFEDA